MQPLQSLHDEWAVSDTQTVLTALLGLAHTTRSTTPQPDCPSALPYHVLLTACDREDAAFASVLSVFRLRLPSSSNTCVTSSSHTCVCKTSAACQNGLHAVAAATGHHTCCRSFLQQFVLHTASKTNNSHCVAGACCHRFQSVSPALPTTHAGPCRIPLLLHCRNCCTSLVSACLTAQLPPSHVHVTVHSP
jgi:hypothetical protein